MISKKGAFSAVKPLCAAFLSCLTALAVSTPLFEASGAGPRAEGIDLAAPSARHAEAMKSAKEIEAMISAGDLKSLEAALSGKLKPRDKAAALKTLGDAKRVRLSRAEAYWGATPSPFYIIAYDGLDGSPALGLRLGKAGNGPFVIEYVFPADNG